MSFTALSVITAAYHKLNKLSPGETLDADSAALAFDELNLIVDTLSAKRQFLYKDVLTTGTQTGNITLAAGDWATIPAGTDIVSMTAAAIEMAPITMSQYNALYDPTLAGTPQVWAHNGLSTVYLWPVPTAVAMVMHTATGVATFADQTTSYPTPQGYQAYLAAALAVVLAPPILGRLPPELVRAETQAKSGVGNYEPAIVDVYSYTQPARGTSIIFNE